MSRIMDALKVILPIVVCLSLGILGRKFKFLNDEIVKGLKFLIVNIILPLAIFHALATMEYSVDNLAILGVLIVVFIAVFALGFALRPLINEKYRKYVPFVISLYENGMIGYLLFSSLFGAENLHYVVFIDIVGLLFGFSVFTTLLIQTDSGEKTAPGKLILNALKSPTFIATVLGVIAGTTGLWKNVISSDFGPVYLSLENMVTAGMSFLVLIVIGYSFQLDKEVIGPTLKMVLIRLVVQTLFCVATLASLHHVLHVDKMFLYATIIMMSCPGAFSVQSYIKNPDGSKFAASVSSLYCVITFVVYIFMVVFAK